MSRSISLHRHPRQQDHQAEWWFLSTEDFNLLNYRAYRPASRFHHTWPERRVPTIGPPLSPASYQCIQPSARVLLTGVGGADGRRRKVRQFLDMKMCQGELEKNVQGLLFYPARRSCGTLCDRVAWQVHWRGAINPYELITGLGDR